MAWQLAFNMPMRPARDMKVMCRLTSLATAEKYVAAGVRDHSIA